MYTQEQCEHFMSQALEQARLAAAEGEVPVGAVIVKDGKVLSAAGNKKEGRGCAVWHAEIVAIEHAAEKAGSWYLEDCDLFVTLEPCVMCAGAIVNSRLRAVYYGAQDVRFGGTVSLYNILSDARLNHTCEVYGGILEKECLQILQDFFKELRKKPKSNKGKKST